MSPEQVGQRVCDAFDEFAAHRPSTGSWEELRQQLLEWFVQVEEQSAFEGMLWVLEHSRRYQHQQLAGELLAQRGLPLSIPPREFLRRIAPTFDASASEVVKYFSSQVGRESAQREIRLLAEEITNDPARSGLRSISYWLGMTDTVPTDS